MEDKANGAGAPASAAFFVFTPPCPPRRRRRSCMTQENLIERLIAENDEFRRLRSEHQSYEQELETLRGTAPLSADQQWRMSGRKKVKLMADGRVECVIRHARP